MLILPSLSRGVCRADVSFGAAKRLICEGGSKSRDGMGSSSLAWLLEEEGENGEDGGFWGWVGLGGIVGGGGERCVEGSGMLWQRDIGSVRLFVHTQFHCCLERPLLLRAFTDVRNFHCYLKF